MKLVYFLFIFFTTSALVSGFSWDRFNVERLFANSETFFEELETADDEKQCVEEFRHFVDELMLGAEWAEKVMDAWAKEPKGLHSDVSVAFGHFDQCIRHADTFQKQYCQIKVENERNMSYSLGVCVPNSCQDKTVYKIMKPFFENVDVTAVSTSFCHNGEDPSFGLLQYFVLLICVVLILAAIIGTYQELMGQKTVLTSFSLYNNANRLFDQKANFGPMNCLNGMRVLSMFWVVFLHSYHNYLYEYALYNPNDFKQFHFTFPRAFLQHGDLAVDTFLVIGGLLMAYNFVKTQESGKKFDLFKYYLHRYLRLIPVFAIVMLISLAFGKYSGNGPKNYEWIGTNMVNNCNKYWWSALLLTQNYLNPTEQCIYTSWYISVDMQLYILSPLVMFPLIKYGKKLYPVLIMASFATFAMMFDFLYNNNFHFESIQGGYSAQAYLSTHVRIGQWLVGVVLGYYLYQTREKTFRINKVVNILLWILSLLILVMALYIPYTQYRDETKNVLIFAAYASTHRFIWALAVAWIIFACVKGYGGPVNWLLSFPFFQPLMKLSYAIYVIHFPLELQIAALQRNLEQFSLFLMFNFFLGLLTLSLLLAIPVVLMVEMPVPGLEAYIFSKFKKRNEMKDKEN